MFEALKIWNKDLLYSSKMSSLEQGISTGTKFHPVTPQQGLTMLALLMS